MALRQEDLEIRPRVTKAVVYRFPVERSEAAQIRADIKRRRAARRRHRAGLAAVVTAVIAMTVMGGGQEATAPAAPQRSTVTVTVQPGDTLWDIAERHAPEGMDPRVYVDFLVRANDIGTTLQPGTKLRLP